jgi:citrate lyase beta subunit
MNVCYLYSPALRIDSLLSHCDQIGVRAFVVDLEDSTHVHSKQRAREKVASFDFDPLICRGWEAGIRVNAISTYDGLADLELLRSLAQDQRCVFEFILLPKITHPAEVKLYHTLLESIPLHLKLYPFIETVEAVGNVDGIASVSDGLCFGQADLVAEMFSPNEHYVNLARARLCVASAKYRIPAIDTNSFEIENLEALEVECLAAKNYGFTAKAAIHPKQVAIIDKVFKVSPETLHKYRSIIDTYESSDVGFSVNGDEVIAPPFVAKARRMLEFYNQRG